MDLSLRRALGKALKSSMKDQDSHIEAQIGAPTRGKSNNRIESLSRWLRLQLIGLFIQFKQREV